MNSIFAVQPEKQPFMHQIETPQHMEKLCNSTHTVFVTALSYIKAPR